MHSIPQPIHPSPLQFERWGIDFIQDLPVSISGNKHIITAIDYASRWVVAKAVPERSSAECKIFIREYSDELRLSSRNILR